MIAVICLLMPVGRALAVSPGASAWGQGTSGELGDGFEYSSDVPVEVSGLAGVEAVAAGGHDSLALLEDGTVMAWGENGLGQLGNGTTKGSSVPVAVSGLSEVTAIAAGFADNLALLSGGTVMAWGYNESGQLGNGTTEDSSVPVPVNALSKATAIAASGDHSLALLSDRTVMAWGENGRGQLGNGTTEDSSVPVAVTGLSEVTAIAAGNWYSLSLLEDGTVMAWGDGERGALGNGGEGDSNVPVAVCAAGEVQPCSHQLDEVIAIAAGGSHSLALLEDGTVMAWGENGLGQLGNGTTKGSSVPVAVSGLSEVTAIAAGRYHSLAVLGNETAMAWGGNIEGQLGNPSAEGNSLVPVAVSGLSEVTAVGAGDQHSVAASAPPPPVPQVTGIEPDYGVGGGGASVDIAGLNFTDVTAVHFGSAAATFVVHSPTSLTATAPPGAGVVDVTVTTPAGTSPKNPADNYRYSPTVDGIAPHSGYPSGGTSVTIMGTNFNEVTAVKFGSTNASSFLVESGSQITAVSPEGTGTVKVIVETEGGSNPQGSAPSFTYSSKPAVEAVSPNHGPPPGGTAVTITGANFTNAEAVWFGSAAASSFTVESETKITAVSPPFAGGAEDAVGVYVETPFGKTEYNGCGTAKRGFIYEPTITSIEPHSGPAAGGTEVTISGAAFIGVIQGDNGLCTLKYPVVQGVRFGLVPATSVDIVSDSQITALAPAGTGAVDVTIEDASPLGSRPINAFDRFTYQPLVVEPPLVSVPPGSPQATAQTGEDGVNQAYKSCLARARGAFSAARKSAEARHGRARVRAMRRARRRKHRATSRCKTRFLA